MAVICDFLRLLRLLNFIRVRNYLKIKWSYHKSKFTKKIVHKGKPAFISVEPTTQCNLKCPQCFTTNKGFTRPKGMLDIETFERIIQQATPYAFYLNLYFQGEPFLNKDLVKFIAQAKQAKFYVAISTNAHYLSADNINAIIDSGLDKIIVSLDGADAETYQQYRKGGDFNKVIEGVKGLVAAKKQKRINHPFIELQFLLNKKNEAQLKQINSFKKTLGVDKVAIKSMQLIHFEQAADWLPGKQSRYTVSGDGTVQIKKELHNYCYRMWNSCVITWNGDVVPCCFDKNTDHAFGNIHNRNLADIWASRVYDDFRKKVFTQRKDIEICRNCNE
jgi:radical SAM protein with 4Fe4S-binding SPASM domain